MKTSDEILVQRILDGDKSSFQFLVDRYKRSVFLHAVKTTRNFHDAEDITQDVFVEAYLKVNNLREPAKFGSWLRGITQNLCRRWMRKKQMLSDLEIPLDNLQTEVINQWLKEQENLESWEFGTDIANKLSDDQKNLLKFFYIDNRSCRDIARQMGATEIAIRKRLSRTRQQLKTELLEGGKNMNSMIAISAMCAFLLGGALAVSAGTLRDDFEDGDLYGWIQVGDGKWEVVDDKCKVSIVGTGSLYSMLMIGELEWRDYSVEIEFQLNQPSVWIGLSARLQDSQNWCSWAIDCTDKTIHWITNVNNQLQVVTGDPVAGNLAGEKHNLKVVVQGNEFKGYHDGAHIRTVQLEMFKTGKVALLFRNWNPPGSAFFDNVIITGDDVPNTGPSGYHFIQPKSKLANTWGRVKQVN